MNAIRIREGEDAARFIRARAGAPASDPAAREAVEPILAAVRRDGDRALRELTNRFDGVQVDRIAVPGEARRSALRDLPADLRNALEHARGHVERAHRAQLRRERPVRPAAGIRLWREFRPIERVGIYVPGGRADYPSTVLMCGIPARLAGCPEIALCSPPGPDGRPAASVLAAAELIGIEEVYAIGGAQAIAAMAYGTESVQAVHKIFGPGNRYVTAAKELVYGAVGIDMPAGPSEIVVLADEAADADWIAADLISQAEHAPDVLAVAVVTSRPLAHDIARAIDGELGRSNGSTREAVMRSLRDGGVCVAPDRATAREWVNALAPEHLEIVTGDPEADLSAIDHAGAVFLGPYSPVAAGDYASGSNHVLPTAGRARAWSALSVDDFGRWMTVQRLEPEGLETIAEVVARLARWERLEAHARAVEIRFGTAEGGNGGGGERGGESGDGRESGDGEESGHGEHGASRPTARSGGPADWVRAHIRTLEPYTAARHIYPRAGSDRLFLDANESPRAPSIPGLADDLNRYPDARCGELRSVLARRLDTRPDRLWIGNGSDEAIDLLLRTFVEPGEPVLTVTPTYGMYGIAARAHAAELREVALDERFDLDVDATLAAAAGARMILLCSPNNPTGNRLSEDRIIECCRSHEGLVVVDEAYVEFSPGRSLIAPVASHRNLVVLRTLSKAWGLAGARVGCFVADPEVVDFVDRINLPYPLSAPASEAALRALGRPEEMAHARDRLIAERERLADRLAGLGFEVFPSEANFVLVRVPDARRAHRRLAEQYGIVVRDRSDLPRLENTLRITVGRPEDTERVCGALEEICR